MPIVLRIILLAAAIVTTAWILSKIRRAQVKTEDGIFWVLFAGVLIFLALFQGVSEWLAGKIGIESAENLVFLFVIGLLLLKVFLLSVRLSVLENKVSVLTTELALRLQDKKNIE